MRTAGIKEGDIIGVNIKGDRYHALVSRDNDEIVAIPLHKGRSLRKVKANQIDAHWRRAVGSRGNA